MGQFHRRPSGEGEPYADRHHGGDPPASAAATTTDPPKVTTSSGGGECRHRSDRGGAGASPACPSRSRSTASTVIPARHGAGVDHQVGIEARPPDPRSRNRARSPGRAPGPRRTRPPRRWRRAGNAEVDGVDPPGVAAVVEARVTDPDGEVTATATARWSRRRRPCAGCRDVHRPGPLESGQRRRDVPGRQHGAGVVLDHDPARRGRDGGVESGRSHRAGCRRIRSGSMAASSSIASLVPSPLIPSATTTSMAPSYRCSNSCAPPRRWRDAHRAPGRRRRPWGSCRDALPVLRPLQPAEACRPERLAAIGHQADELGRRRAGGGDDVIRVGRLDPVPPNSSSSSSSTVPSTFRTTSRSRSIMVTRLRSGTQVAGVATSTYNSRPSSSWYQRPVHHRSGVTSTTHTVEENRCGLRAGVDRAGRGPQPDAVVVGTERVHGELPAARCRAICGCPRGHPRAPRMPAGSGQRPGPRGAEQFAEVAGALLRLGVDDLALHQLLVAGP